MQIDNKELQDIKKWSIKTKVTDIPKHGYAFVAPSGLEKIDRLVAAYEGLKGEVERLTNERDTVRGFVEVYEQAHKEMKEDRKVLQEELERYRTALEEISSKPIIKISGPDLIDLKYEINDIARKALEVSHEPT